MQDAPHRIKEIVQEVVINSLLEMRISLLCSTSHLRSPNSS